MSLSSSTALALLTSHAFIAKVYITLAFRAMTTMDKSNAKNVKRIMDSQEMKRSVSAQNNEAEWANIFIATLGILYLKGYNTHWASTLAVAGQICYFWPRALIGHCHEGGIDPPPYVPGALMRYISLFLIAKTFWERFI